MAQLTHIFRKREEPYAGADLATAKRLGGAILLLLVLVSVTLTPLEPPTSALGDAGWAAWAAAIVGFVAAARVMRRRPDRMGAGGLLLVGYLAVVQIGVLEWLAGGQQSPYHHLLLPAAIFVAAVHPPRRAPPL